jgi:magnesium chelatase subunit H
MPSADAAAAVPVRVTVVTMDSHLATAASVASRVLKRDLPGLRFSMHAAADFAARPEALAACLDDIAKADILIVTMLFMEDHFKPVFQALKARRDGPNACDAIVCAMCAAEVVKLTRLGRFDMDKPASGPLALLKRLRGKPEKGEGGGSASGGAQQMRMLRRIPQFLRFIPGTAQDVRAYFLTLQYWLGGSEANVANLVRFLVDRYAAGPRAVLRGRLSVEAPLEYPDVGLYHPRMKVRTGALPVSDKVGSLPEVVPKASAKGRVGLLLLRSYVIADNARHYDGVIAALESQGLQVVPAFAAGLDARPAMEAFFMRDGMPAVDAVVSLTGFSLVGGPAYNDAKAAETMLSRLDVPYLSVNPLEFQSIGDWGASERGLLPVEATVMVAIPELDGATGSMVYAGRGPSDGAVCTGCAKACHFEAPDSAANMQVCTERTAMLAARVAKLVALRRSQRRQRKLALVIFNFPPNAGHVGTAAYLSVFESAFETLKALKRQGYEVELPRDADALRQAVLEGNAKQFGADANVHHRIPVDDYVRHQPWLREIEAQWGAAPGRVLSDGRSIFVLGAQFGNVLLAVQPGMGYEGDPMRLLFERGFAPTHAFAAFYDYLKRSFQADAVLHFGTHGALEFMPGKQTGMSAQCWPDRLIGDLPNFYLYAANNPSEGTIAKRRAAATLVSYLTPPLAEAGLYKGLNALRASLEQWRALPPNAEPSQRDRLAEVVQAQAAELELTAAEPPWLPPFAEAETLWDRLLELEYTLIPHGLHVVGKSMSAQEKADTLLAMLDAAQVSDTAPWIDPVRRGRINEAVREFAGGASAEFAAKGDAMLAERLSRLEAARSGLGQDGEIDGLMQALDGRFVRPSPAGDVVRTPEILPTGRNLHGFDPFRIPSAFAVREGSRLADLLIARHVGDGHPLPESVALVLWGTDNLKTEGVPIAQALALLGAEPRYDSYGRLAGAQLKPLASLGRPRIDVVISLSGIFRDLLPLQIKLLAEAALLAAQADEPCEMNFVRKHALAYQAAHGGDMATAALRVFGNAEGVYGANVNLLVENSSWDNEDQLAETYARRKGFAYGCDGRPSQQPALLTSVLAGVELAYQNLDSVELGVTTIDTYFDTLGGISRAVKRARGGTDAPVYIGDQTRGSGVVRSLSEQVALETRTRTLNPKWYEGMLAHGYEGVRQIESHVTNTFAWSATTGQVQPWVYQQLTQTFVLDPEMRERLARLNPSASVKVANRLLEAHDRKFWTPDAATLEALRRAGEELEDRLEGVYEAPAPSVSLTASPIHT